MHELPIMKQVLEVALTYAEQQGAKEIKSIRICAGETHDLIPELVEKYFAYISRSTIAENAKIEMEILPIICLCRSCGERFIFHLRALKRTEQCPLCGSDEYEIVNGSELFVDSIEISR